MSIGDRAGSSILKAIPGLVPKHSGLETNPQTQMSPATLSQIPDPSFSAHLGTSAILDSLIYTYFTHHNTSYPILHEGTSQLEISWLPSAPSSVNLASNILHCPSNRELSSWRHIRSWAMPILFHCTVTYVNASAGVWYSPHSSSLSPNHRFQWVVISTYSVLIEI